MCVPHDLNVKLTNRIQCKNYSIVNYIEFMPMSIFVNQT